MCGKILALNTFREYVDIDEISKVFYIKASEKELNLLLSDKIEYRKYIDKITKNIMIN